MFVRSQNRKELVEITGMVISVHGQNIHVVGRATVQIAAYEKEEQCLRIVDQLQNAAKEGETLYEMPQAKDVRSILSTEFC